MFYKLYAWDSQVSSYTPLHFSCTCTFKNERKKITKTIYFELFLQKQSLFYWTNDTQTIHILYVEIKKNKLVVHEQLTNEMKIGERAHIYEIIYAWFVRDWYFLSSLDKNLCLSKTCVYAVHNIWLNWQILDLFSFEIQSKESVIERV